MSIASRNETDLQQESSTFSRIHNEPELNVRNFSRFEIESRSRNFSRTNVELNESDILRIENERPHAPLPRVIDVGDDVRREAVDRGYDRFPATDATTRRSLEHGFVRPQESNDSNQRSSDNQRDFPSSIIQSEASSSVFNSASSEELLVC